MRKLLNTIYITNEKAYLTLDGENIVCKLEDNEKFRIPFDNVEGIVCFSYIGCSPALMGKCVEKLIPINFISPTGKYLACVTGPARGNVFLRVNQQKTFLDSNLSLAKNTVAAKVSNSISLIKRSMHDNEVLRSDEQIINVIEIMKSGINSTYNSESIDEILGIEGNCAKYYFSVFNKLLNNKNFEFVQRTKRPPLDPVNAVLSFVYTLYISEYRAALETVGLDSCIGYYHALRSGRCSLACDMIEETRCLVDRFVLTVFNLGILNNGDFDVQISGSVLLNDDGRKKVITRWQDKKRSEMLHPYINQKIPFGLLPYVQSNLMAKYVRGDIAEYSCFLLK